MACLWYLQASVHDNIWDTWVGARGIVDSTPNEQYWQAYYWAFQTVSTVGYGDFTVNTVSEYLFALIWMVAGTNLYAFVIGSISSWVALADKKDALFDNKLQMLTKYSVQHQLPKAIQHRMAKHLENEKNFNIDEDVDDLLSNLPKELRTEIMTCTQSQIISGVSFLKTKPASFLIEIVPRLQQRSSFEQDILYS